MDRKTTFIVALVYLLVLLALGFIYVVNKGVHDSIPAFLGSVHIGVPWFGAVGSVLISLTGVSDHEHDRDKDLWPWHVTRPFIGFALGIVSVLIFQAGILAVGTTAAANTDLTQSALLPDCVHRRISRRDISGVLILPTWSENVVRSA